MLSGEVEFDEVYVVANRKGNPVAVSCKGREEHRNRLSDDREVEHWKKKVLRYLEWFSVVALLLYRC